MNKKNILSKYDLFITIIVTAGGTSIFSYPRVLSENIGTDGWFVIILSGIFVIPFIYFIYKSIKINGYMRFTDMLQNNFGSILGKIIALYVVLSGCFIIGVETRIFTEVLKMYLLPKTPTEFIILVMLLVGGFLVRGEVESVIRFNEIAFWIMFGSVILTIPFVLKGADFTNILPILTHKPLEYIKATKNSVFSILGFEIIYMVLPLVKKKEEMLKVTFKSILFIILFYIIITITTLFVFPKEYNAHLLWPTITMFSTVDIPGTFIERWEGVVMIFWFMFYFTTFVNLYYFNSEIIRDVFNLEDVKISLVLITPIIYILSLYPENIAEVYSIKDKLMPYIGSVIIGILPILLLVIGLNKSRRIKNET